MKDGRKISEYQISWWHRIIENPEVFSHVVMSTARIWSTALAITITPWAEKNVLCFREKQKRYGQIRLVMLLACPVPSRLTVALTTYFRPTPLSHGTYLVFSENVRKYLWNGIVSWRQTGPISCGRPSKHAFKALKSGHIGGATGN